MSDFWSAQRVLVLAPHPDDEAFGCAGTIARVKAAGGAVFVMVGSVGDLQQYTDGSPVITSGTRSEEMDRAMSLLGVDGYEILFSDTERHMRLDALPQRELIGLIERDGRYAIDRVRPSVLILPAPTYNQDHEAMFKAGFAACRPHLRQHKAFVNLVLSCEGPQMGWSATPAHPNFYVDISEYLNVKLDALACHASQMRPEPHHASIKNVERLARIRGAEIAVDAAEAFVCHRMVL